MPAQIMAVGLRDCICVPVGAWDGTISLGSECTINVADGLSGPAIAVQAEDQYAHCP